MFYGTIKSEGTLDTRYSHSNNFTVWRDANIKGHFIIKFDQHFKYRPTVTLGADYFNATLAGLVSYEWDGCNQQLLHVYTWEEDHVPQYFGFSFVATPGMLRHFEVTENNDNITLIPTVEHFENANGKTTKVLVLEAKHPGLNIYLDKGTKLIAVGHQVAATLGATTVEAAGRVWKLSARTYGESQGPYGKAWTTNGEFLESGTLDLGSDHLLSSPFTFAILGTLKGTPDPEGGIPQHITSDPVVRLSSVAAGGLVLS